MTVLLFQYKSPLTLIVLLVTSLSDIHCQTSSTCSKVKKLDSIKNLTKEDIKSLKQTNDLEMCVVLLGKDQVSLEMEGLLWRLIVEYFGGAENIPDESLRVLGWIISGIPVQDFKNISFSEIDTISAFGTYRNLSQAQLFALKESVQDEWSGKAPEDFTGYDLASLQNILCAYNTTEIAAIHADSYKMFPSLLNFLVETQVLKALEERDSMMKFACLP